MSIPKLKDLINELNIEKPKKIGGVVVKSEGQVLLVRRSENAGKYPNFWAVPMGHVEEGEKFIQGAHREFQEETMLDIDINSLVYLDTIKDSKYNRIVKLYMIELQNKPEPKLDEEHSDWGYYDVKSLPRPIEDNLRVALELKA
jgi:ADP-ribose pyrophosphatase YjhB (NUDIX family)